MMRQARACMRKLLGGLISGTDGTAAMVHTYRSHPSTVSAATRPEGCGLWGREEMCCERRCSRRAVTLLCTSSVSACPACVFSKKSLL